MNRSPGTAARRWADALASWAIPPDILAQAPQSPWAHPVALFVARGDEPVTASTERAREALPGGGSVLDVGCGGGRAAFAAVPPAGTVTGVDAQPAMLEAFADGARARGLRHAEVLGDWPAVAADVADADVVVCHHVVYNVADLVPFVRALDARARYRVVLELPLRHPLARMAPLWQRFWAVERPDGPAAHDALDVVREAGFDARLEEWDDPAPPREAALDLAEQVRWTRIRLCLPVDRDDEIAAALAAQPPSGPRRLATLWWDTGRCA